MSEAAVYTAGIVYTETVVHSPTERYANDAPYQLAILDLAEGGRLTARILGERCEIGDAVEFAESAGGVAYFRKKS